MADATRKGAELPRNEKKKGKKNPSRFEGGKGGKPGPSSYYLERGSPWASSLEEKEGRGEKKKSKKVNFAKSAHPLKPRKENAIPFHLSFPAHPKPRPGKGRFLQKRGETDGQTGGGEAMVLLRGKRRWKDPERTRPHGRKVDAAGEEVLQGKGRGHFVRSQKGDLLSGGDLTRRGERESERKKPFWNLGESKTKGSLGGGSPREARGRSGLL